MATLNGATAPASNSAIAQAAYRAYETKDRAATEALLADAQVSTRLPAKDLARARRFYSEKLGLEPVEERPGGLRYQCGGSSFALFESAGSASGTHTQMALEVDDLDATIAALRARGVKFEEYNTPGLETNDGVADIAANYPSKGVGERGAWFRDSEGNLLGLGQPVRAQRRPDHSTA
jgi:catechol 2,3-dioxygenase-like lactoylglutathione lyase family enzyme